jgi:hypothetical protein
MDEIEVISGNFKVWLNRFLPGYSGGDCKMVHVPMEKVVDRFVLEKNRQMHKEQLLDQWKREIQAVGVTLTDITLNESQWNG